MALLVIVSGIRNPNAQPEPTKAAGILRHAQAKTVNSPNLCNGEV